MYENTKKQTAEREKEILAFWKQNRIFEKTLAKKSPEGEFVFYDGPPFATGLPHYGHILAGVIKDAIPRWKTMQGFHVRRRWGWDCHGLPVENLIEKELDLETKKDIEIYGTGRFNEAARESVLRYTGDWKEVISRTGRWVDMEASYHTMDSRYTESVWWVFKTLFEKGLVYEGFKPMHLCPRCETTLSNFEVSQGYTEIIDLAVTVKLPLADEPDIFLLIWTTTPWTLPGNMAVAVNEEIIYGKFSISNSQFPNERYIVAKDRAKDVFGEQEYTLVEEFKGEELVGKKYEPPFDYYKDTALSHKENAWKVYAAPFVSTDEGTGIVHIAPAFGEDDMRLAEAEKIPIVHHVGTDGKFKSEVRDFVGLSVKPKGDHQRTDILVIKYLAGKNLLFGKEKITHSYPLCWRCETPLINYAANSWFVAVTKIKDKLVAANESIRWVPGDIKEGRFGNWLKGARDWAISRSRYWGAPIPVWKNKETGKIVVIGSIDELRKKAKKSENSAWLFNDDDILDLHRPQIDTVEILGADGELLERVPDVFDCWFESGAMPYGGNHYPFENKETFDPEKGKGFPADFIAEGLDQTRGWFYSLLVLAVALFGKTAYKNVIVNGLILAEDGRKMSKRLKNYPDPVEVMDKYGADALRFYLLSSPVARGEDINFSEKGVKEVESKVISRALNVLAFYELYSVDLTPNTYNLKPSSHVLDQWIHARLEETVSMVSLHMERYELDKATRPLALFIDDLSTWYLRRSRERLKSADSAVSTPARAALRHTLLEFSKTIAPFMPFVAEELYRSAGGTKESVHLEDWPEYASVSKVSEFLRGFWKGGQGRGIISDMDAVRAIVSQGLLARAKAGIRVRQPLQELRIKNDELRIKKNDELVALIKDEMNVKGVMFGANIENDVSLDTEITPELKKEGQARELIRAVQELRKQSNLMPNDEAVLLVKTNEEGKTFIQEHEMTLKDATTLGAVEFEEDIVGEEVVIDDMTFTLQLRQ